MTVAVLGLILLVAAGVLTAAVVTSNTGAIETDLWGTTISNISVGAVFVAGMLTTLVGVAGLFLLMAGARRGRRLQQERRVLRRENQRLTQQVGSGAPAGGQARAPGAWRRRRAPAGTPAAGPTASTEEPASRSEDAPVDTAGRPADATERSAENVDQPAGAPRERTTSDAGR
jgi:hypothetical protein